MKMPPRPDTALLLGSTSGFPPCERHSPRRQLQLHTKHTPAAHSRLSCSINISFVFLEWHCGCSSPADTSRVLDSCVSDLRWRPHSAGQPAELVVPDGPQRDGIHDGIRQRHPV